MRKMTLLVLALGMALAGCNGSTNATTDPVGKKGNVPGSTVQLANPASQNCIKRGGHLKIQKTSGGGEYGVCYFEDNRQCEEWALFRGTCPEGGVKVTGYDSEAQIFCAISGGMVDMHEDTCTIDGQTYNTEKYYHGEP
ncbi:MAG: DUF333 domain-containing protein [Desulfoplanes sp.]